MKSILFMYSLAAAAVLPNLIPPNHHPAFTHTVPTEETGYTNNEPTHPYPFPSSKLQVSIPSSNPHYFKSQTSPPLELLEPRDQDDILGILREEGKGKEKRDQDDAPWSADKGGWLAWIDSMGVDMRENLEWKIQEAVEGVMVCCCASFFSLCLRG